MAEEREASVALLDETVQLAKILKNMYGKQGDHLKNLQSITGTEQLLGRIEEFIVEVDEYSNVILEAWKHSHLIGHYMKDIKATLENIQKCFQNIQLKTSIALTLVKSKWKLKVSTLHQVLQSNCAKLLASVTSQSKPLAQDLTVLSQDSTIKQALDKEYRDANDWYYGISRPKNYSIAFSKYTDLAAKSKHKDAMYMLSECYRNGHGIDRNEDLERVWFKRSVDFGSLNARMKFARALLENEDKITEKVITDFISRIQQQDSPTGNGVEKDFEKPERASLDDYTFSDIYVWMNEANEEVLDSFSQANFEIELLLGLIYEKVGDFANALQWYDVAASHGSSEATYHIGLIYFRGKSVIPQSEVAFEYFISAARSGIVDALYHVGVCFEHGIGVDRSLIDAMDYYNRASNQAHSPSMHSLGFLLLNRARRFAENIERAAEGQQDESVSVLLSRETISNLNTAQGLWLRLVKAKIASDKSLHEYNNIHAGGSIDEMENKDVKFIDAIARLGVQWMKRAVDAGVWDAAFQLGQIYETGFSVIPMDPISSFSHYLSAASAGHSSSAYCIANMYYRGIGTKVDVSKALYFYKKAAVLGKNPDAMNSLGILLEDSVQGLGNEDSKDVEEFEKNILEACCWFYEAAIVHNFVIAGENLLSLILRNTWVEKFYDTEGTLHVIDDVKCVLLKKVPDAQYIVEKIKEEIEAGLFKTALASKGVPLPLLAAGDVSGGSHNENNIIIINNNNNNNNTNNSSKSQTVKLLLSSSFSGSGGDETYVRPSSYHSNLKAM